MAESIKTLCLDASLLEQYVETLGTIGWQTEGGIIRPVYSPAWVEARKQLAEWMHGVGLEVHEDAVGNLFGRLRGTADDTHTILTGSHIDTVKLGGKFDGALGVLSALVALRALREQVGQPHRSIEVVALCEEEGSRFFADCWGTRAILGLIQAQELHRLYDDDNITIAEAMHAVGLSPECYQDARRQDLNVFLELHIEQGPILFEEKIDVGIVEAITGFQQQFIIVEGRADHAGTTPMDARQDAFQGAALMAIEMTRLVEQEGRPAVVTMGKWDIRPGAANVVPGQVRFSVDLRHPDEATKLHLAEACRARCEIIAKERGLSISSEVAEESTSRKMDPVLQRVLIRSATECGATWKYMTSGAGHDSQVMAQRIPTAMLFVPSVDGHSHSPAEYTTREHATGGATVLAAALYQLAY